MTVGEEQAQSVRARQARASEERRKRFGVLLVAILAAFAVQGIAEPGRWEQLIVSVLLAATLLLALGVAEARPALVRAYGVVASILVIVSFVNAVVGKTDGSTAQVANLFLVFLAPPAIGLGIVRTLRARNRVTVEAVLGVICLYLLVGMFFALVYAVIGRIDGTFFADGAQTTTARCLYFSFTTLTTVGFGDFTASGNFGHTLSVSEALIGQIYLVTVVSVIVANLGRTRPPASLRPHP